MGRFEPPAAPSSPKTPWGAIVVATVIFLIGVVIGRLPEILRSFC